LGRAGRCVSTEFEGGWPAGQVGTADHRRVDHQHRLGLSDSETLAQLRENPYLQYFCGFERFVHEAAFAPTLFVKLRERLSPARFAAFEQAVIDRMALFGQGAGRRRLWHMHQPALVQGT